MPGGFEAAQPPLALAARLVRGLRPVVQSLVLAVLDARQRLPLRRPVAGQLVSDEDPRHVLQATEQLAEELPGRGLVAAALHQDVEDMPVLVDRPPQIVRLPIDRDEDLIKVPLVAWPGTVAAQRIRVGLAELAAPLADRFVRDDHAVLGEALLHVVVAQGEAEGQPDGVGNDLGGEA